MLFLVFGSFASAVATPGESSPKRVTGIVTDSKTGNALPGATILLKGTKVGANSDTDGKYSI